jgi:hypothetical protein
MSASEDPLTNGQIAELLAIAGDDAKPPLNRAYRRASREALLWEEEAACLYQEGRLLTELPGVGPYLERIIRGWIEVSPIVGSPPATREKFFTLTQVRSVLGGRPLTGGEKPESQDGERQLPRVIAAATLTLGSTRTGIGRIRRL